MKRRKFLEISSKGTIVVSIVPAIIASSTCIGGDDSSLQRIEPIKAPFEMPQLQRPVFPDKIFDIREFGAIGDGATMNTKAFRQAIAACTAGGGGKVMVPAGKWLIGAIHLKSNVNLHLEKGAELHFSDRPDDYLPVVFTRWAGFEIMNYSPLIYAIDCENIAITGPGKLYGHGQLWWSWQPLQEGPTGTGMQIQDMVLKGVPPEKRVFGKPEYGLRPQFINPVRCRNVLLEGFTIAQPGPFWTIQFVYCENIIVRRLTLQVKGGPNNDGINLDSSCNALVEHCMLDTEDDAICLKSGVNEDGRRVGRPTEKIVVRNICSQNGIWGGISIGSEMSGGVRNIFVHDCKFTNTGQGIYIKSNSSRGGTVEHIWYQNLIMSNVRVAAIQIDADYKAWLSNKDGKSHPVFCDIEFKGITCDGAAVAVNVIGKQEQPIERIIMKNIFIKAEKGMTFNWVNDLKLINVKSESAKGEPILFMNCKNVDQEPITGNK